jgi:hypothetical protein
LKRRSKEERLLISYLLSELTEPELSRIETRYFHDRQFHELILTLEEELMLDYLRGDLSGRERERFEAQFLSSERRRNKYEFTKHLASCAGRAPQPTPDSLPSTAISDPRSWFDWIRQSGLRIASTAALASVLLSAGSWLFLKSRNTDSHSQPAGGQIALQQQTPVSSASVDKTPPAEQSNPPELVNTPSPLRRNPRPAPSLFAAVINLSDVRTNNGVSEINIPRNVGTLQLNAPLGETDYSIYNVVIKTMDGEEVFRKHRLRKIQTKSGEMVVLRLPALLLHDADYVFNLSGVTDAGDAKLINESFFRVNKR